MTAARSIHFTGAGWSGWPRASGRSIARYRALTVSMADRIDDNCYNCFANRIQATKNALGIQGHRSIRTNCGVSREELG